MYEKHSLKEIIGLLNDNGLTEISIKDGDKEVVVKKEQKVAAAAAIPAETRTIQENITVKTDTRKSICSPMVGTFYAASSPDAAPFVEVGDVIAEGQTVCVIEAMKLMNEIESDVSGRIVEICVQNAQPVEFGQVLMYVE